MQRVHPNFFGFLLLSFFLIGSFLGQAQKKQATTLTLVTYLSTLETDFNVKFSFVDKDLEGISIQVPEIQSLAGILDELAKQTHLTIVALNERYYTITSQTITVCGTILDNLEQDLVGAEISIFKDPKASISQRDHHFFIENISPKAVIKIKYLGYKPYFTTARELGYAEPCKKIKLTQIYQELEEVILYNFLTSGLQKKEDASILVRTNNFGILPGLIEPDVLQTVQALPGIKSIDETVSDINVRGGTNDQNLILWDGIKMYQSGHFFGLISAFNPYLTDKVTIVKNGTSATYGDGVSSVIAMESKNRMSDSIFGGAGINLISGDAFGYIPITNSVGFQFSGRRSYTDIVNTPTYRSFYTRAFQDSEIVDETNNERISTSENFYFYDVTGKLLYDINDGQKLRLSFISMSNLLNFQKNMGASERSESTLEQANFSIGANLESQWNANFSTRFNSYYTNYNLDSENIFENNVQELAQSNEVLEAAIHFSSSYNFSEQLNWLNGYQFNEVGITNFTNVSQPPFRSNTKGVIRTHALFSELNYTSKNEKLWARTGLRMNFIENINTFQRLLLEPRVNLTYTLDEDFRINFQGEFKNQSTNQVIDLQQNFLGIEKRRWILADEDKLPITTSKQASLGLSYDTNKLYVGLEGFYKFVNGISTLTQGFQNQNQFNGELGEYAINGAEFLINHKTKAWSTWLSYTYNNNTYHFEEIVPNNFPNNLDITHTLSFASTYSYDNLKLGIGLNYRTGRPFTEPQGGPAGINTNTFPLLINYESPNSSRITEYIRADASLMYDFKFGSKIKATTGFSMLNIFDRQNILNIYYRLNTSNEIERIENVSLGITPNFSFRVFF